VKDWKETIENIVVAWAVMAITPFFDVVDIPVIFFFSKLLNLTYAQVWVMYMVIAVLVLIFLAPKKLKIIYYKIRRWLR